MQFGFKVEYLVSLGVFLSAKSCSTKYYLPMYSFGKYVDVKGEDRKVDNQSKSIALVLMKKVNIYNWRLTCLENKKI